VRDLNAIAQADYMVGAGDENGAATGACRAQAKAISLLKSLSDHELKPAIIADAMPMLDDETAP
jgi:hypothetical protein